jgi:hypothetical protein
MQKTQQKGAGLRVILTSRGNPDLRQDPERELPGVPTSVVCVKDLEAASVACREFIEAFDLGGGNWILPAGLVTDGVTGDRVAKIAYNGKITEGAGKRPAVKTDDPPDAGLLAAVQHFLDDSTQRLCDPDLRAPNQSPLCYARGAFHAEFRGFYPRDMDSLLPSEEACTLVAMAHESPLTSDVDQELFERHKIGGELFYVHWYHTLVEERGRAATSVCIVRVESPNDAHELWELMRPSMDANPSHITYDWALAPRMMARLYAHAIEAQIKQVFRINDFGT